MKMIVAVALALVAVAAALPVEKAEFIPIVRSESNQEPNGPYAFNYESADGSKRQETGELKDVVGEDSKPHPVVVMRGSYEYPGADGKPVVVQYYADETGFHAEGDSIPKPARR